MFKHWNWRKEKVEQQSKAKAALPSSPRSKRLPGWMNPFAGGVPNVFLGLGGLWSVALSLVAGTPLFGKGGPFCPSDVSHGLGGEPKSVILFAWLRSFHVTRILRDTSQVSNNIKNV